MERLTGWNDLLQRLGLVLVFCVVFFLLWQPMRQLAAGYVAAPILEMLASTGDTVSEVMVRPKPPAVFLGFPEGREPVTVSVPAGLYFFLPAVFLLLVAPRKPYWFVQLLFVLGLGVLEFLCAAIGVLGVQFGFVAHEFVARQLVRALSIAIPLILLSGLWKLEWRDVPLASRL